MAWKGFIEESKSYMNHPDYWKEWQAQLYLVNGEPDLCYSGWTQKDKRKAILNFWSKFPRAWFRFYGFWLCDMLKSNWQKGKLWLTTR